MTRDGTVGVVTLTSGIAEGANPTDEDKSIDRSNRAVTAPLVAKTEKMPRMVNFVISARKIKERKYENMYTQ